MARRSLDRHRNRKIALLALLAVLLALAAYLVYYFTLNKSLPTAPPVATAEDVIVPPQFLYAISGTGANALGRPVGVAIGPDNRLYVSDTERSRISVFTLSGRYLSAFSTIADGKRKALSSPVHLAFDAKGDLWVSDRILDQVYVFGKDGKFSRTFKPSDASLTRNWSPLAVAFDNQQRFYMSDVGDTDNHKILVFDPTGRLAVRFGKTAQVNLASDSPGDFYFPNGIAVSRSGLIFVADGNNRRIEVFGRDGKYQYMIASSGVPRGIFIDEKNQRLVVSDGLANQVDLYDFKGQKLVSFGESGTGPGQFQYPNDVAMDSAGRIYVADRENHQVQVWGWPQASPAPVLSAIAQRWYWCLTPLLLLPLLLFLRRRNVIVTPDFVDALVATEDVPLMQNRRLRWLASEDDHPVFEGRVEAGVDLGELIQPSEHSDSDARDLVDRLTVDMPTAVRLALAQRAKWFATEDEELRKLALLLDIDVIGRDEFVERFGKARR